MRGASHWPGRAPSPSPGGVPEKVVCVSLGLDGAGSPSSQNVQPTAGCCRDFLLGGGPRPLPLAVPILSGSPAISISRDGFEGGPSVVLRTSPSAGAWSGPPPVPFPNSTGGLDVGPSTPSCAAPSPSLRRLWCTQFSLDSQAAGPGRRPGPYGSCRLRAKRLGWEGHFPQPVYQDPRPLSPVPICCLPLSQWGQPLVPSSSLPATHFLPAAQGYRNTHAQLGSCVCECVPTPQSLHLEGCQRAWGCRESSHPRTHILLNLQACPGSSHRAREWQVGVSRRPGEGLS